jgi:hypothetical protein
MAEIPFGIEVGLALFLPFAGLAFLTHGFTLIKIEKHYHHDSKDGGSHND